MAQALHYTYEGRVKYSGSVKKLRCECLWGGGRGSITQESPEIAFPCRTVQNPRLPFQLSTGPPSVKTNAYLALPGSVVLSLSPSITSQKKDKLARENKNKKKSCTFAWLAAAAHQRRRRGGEQEKALIVFVFPKCKAIFLACHVWPCCEVMHCFFFRGLEGP